MFPEAVTHPVVLLMAANLIGMILEGKTALIGAAMIIDETVAGMFEVTAGILGTMLDMTVGGSELEEWLSVPY